MARNEMDAHAPMQSQWTSINCFWLSVPARQAEVVMPKAWAVRTGEGIAGDTEEQTVTAVA